MNRALIAAITLSMLALTAAHAGQKEVSNAPAPALQASVIDHVGINVPDVEVAIGFFHDLLGTRVISDIRPGEIPEAWKARFNWHQSSELLRFVMLELPGGAKIELFQYEGAEVNRSQPHQDDAGSTHIALRTADIGQSLAVIKARGLTVLNEPITNADGVKWFYFRTPWGSHMELVSLPHA